MVNSEQWVVANGTWMMDGGKGWIWMLALRQGNWYTGHVPQIDR